jgi:hypothetical protein
MTELIFIFVIWIGESAKADISLMGQNRPCWESHNSTKPSYSHPSSVIEIAYVSDAIKNEQPRKYSQQQIGRTFVFSLCAVIVGFFGSLWGWDNFYSERRLLGAALIILSWLLGTFGFVAWGGLVL